MDQRLQFVADHQRALYDMTALCARYGVSRKTGYKWLARYAEAGPAALLLATRRAHPTWGPAKLVQYLAPRHPEVED